MDYREWLADQKVKKKTVGLHFCRCSAEGCCGTDSQVDHLLHVDCFRIITATKAHNKEKEWQGRKSFDTDAKSAGDMESIGDGEDEDHLGRGRTTKQPPLRGSVQRSTKPPAKSSGSKVEEIDDDASP